MLEDTEASFLDLERDPDNKQIIDQIFRLAHTVKGSAYAAGFTDLAEFAHVFETLLGQIKSGHTEVTKDVVDTLLTGNDVLKEFVEVLEEDSDGELDTEDAKEEIRAFLHAPKEEEEFERVGQTELAPGLFMFDDDEDEPAPTAPEPVSAAPEPAPAAPEPAPAAPEPAPAASEVNPVKNVGKAIHQNIKKNRFTDIQKFISPGTVLIVDDEPAVLEILEYYLEELECKVLTAPDGKKAFEVMTEESVDLIITDIKMPEMTGIEFIQKVKTIDKKIPVIFASGAATKEDVVETIKLGAFDFLEKPYSEQDIQFAVRNATTMKRMKDAAVYVASLNFKAYMQCIKFSKMNDKTDPEKKRATQERLENLLDEIAAISNVILDMSSIAKVSDG